MTSGRLERAVQVLEAFRPGESALRFAQLQERTGMPKASLHRLLAELTRLRLLDPHGDEGYVLGGRLFELGMRASVERDLLEVATPFLQDLYERTHEIVHLGVREGVEVVYVAKLGGHRQARMPSRLGGRMPLHATAIGKALLAHAPDDIQQQVLGGPLRRIAPRTITAPGRLRAQLESVHATGVAYEIEESSVGTVCVGSAIVSDPDDVLAAISVSGPASRFKPQQHASSVQAAAAGIAATLARRRELEETARRAE